MNPTSICSSILNVQHALLTLGDPTGAIYKEVCDVFLDDLPRMTQLLNDSFDDASLVPVLHELANSLCAIGALNSGERLRSLEIQARKGAFIDRMVMVMEVVDILDSVEKAVKKWKDLEGAC